MLDKISLSISRIYDLVAPESNLHEIKLLGGISSGLLLNNTFILSNVYDFLLSTVPHRQVLKQFSTLPPCLFLNEALST